MNLFSGILKMIQMLGLVSDSQEFQLLHNDVNKWTLEKATKDSDDKLGQFYWKLHQGIWFRLAMPFIFFWAMKEAKKIMSPEVEGDDF
jgi:hypothetical protein